MFSENGIQIAGKQIYKKPDSTDVSILEIVKNKGRVSYEDIALELSIDKSTVSRRVKKLIQEGLVISIKEGRKSILIWVGGTPAMEDAIQKSIVNQIPAAILAEYYDTLVLKPFSIFSLLFEDHYWEIISNLKPGFNDVEIGQWIGKSISLDSIRRVLVICNSHNIISLKNLRDPSISDFSMIFEPIYQINTINQEMLDRLIIIRGLASAMVNKNQFGNPTEVSHFFDPILEIVESSFETLKNEVNSINNLNDQEILRKILINYDFARDMDRIFRGTNWRNKIKDSNIVKINTKNERLGINPKKSSEFKKKILKEIIS